MFKRGKRSGSSRAGKLTQWVSTLRQNILMNTILIRTVALTVSLLLLVGGPIVGMKHSQALSKERAMTVTNYDQDIGFSLMNVSLTLQPQRINGDTLVVPFTISSMTNMSADASDYSVFAKYSDGSRLPEDVSGNLALFGPSGEGAIILSGPLEQKPLQVVLRDDADIEAGRSETGTFVLDGDTAPVDFNAATFVINPRAENLTEDEIIRPGMSFSDLYMAAVGNRALLQFEVEEERITSEISELSAVISEYEARLQQANAALNLPDNDRERLGVGSGSSTFRPEDVDSETTEMIGQVNLSNSDMRVLRDRVLQDLSTSERELRRLEDSLAAVESQRANMETFIREVPRITTLGTNFSELQ